MISITGFILLLSTLYAAIRLIFLLPGYKNLYYIFLFGGILAASVSIAALEVDNYLNSPALNVVYDWGRAFSVSFILTGLAVLIRDSKPSFARMPALFSFMPLLVIPVFFLSMHSDALKEMVLAMLQGAGLIIAVMLYFLKSTRSRDAYFVSGGTVLMMVAFIVYWLPASVWMAPIWLIQIMITASVLLIIHGLVRLEESGGGELHAN